MVKKKKSFWRIFRPVAVVVVGLFTSLFAAQSPELSPVINAVGKAVQQVILTAENSIKCDKDTTLVDSVQTVAKPLAPSDSVVHIS